MFGLLGTLATSILGGMFQQRAQTSAASAASAAQQGMSREAIAAQMHAQQLAIAEQRRQFDALVKRSQPYMQAGQMGLNGMLNLAGLNGSQAQKKAVNGLQNGADFQESLQQGENAILGNAAATGGLRGGNTQAALGQFAPAMLQQAIDQQYARFGGLGQMGQNTAMSVGTQGMGMANQIGATLGGTANQIGTQYGNIGQAQAGQAIANGQAGANMWGGLAGAAGSFFGGLPANATWASTFGGGRL
jgi:hypothetical protein